MDSVFAGAVGSVPGREHIRVGKNNQDACFVGWFQDAAIAIVCDGCSSAAHSEVGSKLGVRFVAEAVRRSLPTTNLERVQQEVLGQLRQLALTLGDRLTQVVQDYLLFTVVGVVIRPDLTTMFGLGDGVMVLNGARLPVPTFPGNAPPYLAYGLLENSPLTPQQLQFQIYSQVPTDTVQSLLIGSDGVQDVIAATDSWLPGKQERVGGLAQFWESDRYFQNPDYLRRRLALMNRDVIQPDWPNQQVRRAGGLLPDDTTMIVIRRKVQ